jgi:hypothetical protein
MKAQVQVTQVSSKLRWQAPLSRTQTQGPAPRWGVWLGSTIFLPCPKTTLRFIKEKEEEKGKNFLCWLGSIQSLTRWKFLIFFEIFDSLIVII